MTWTSFSEELVKAFCPTGEGGGIDNSCPPGGAATYHGTSVDSAMSILKNGLDSKSLNFVSLDKQEAMGFVRAVNHEFAIVVVNGDCPGFKQSPFGSKNWRVTSDVIPPKYIDSVEIYQDTRSGPVLLRTIQKAISESKKFYCVVLDLETIKKNMLRLAA